MYCDGWIGEGIAMGVLVKALRWVCWCGHYDGCVGDGITMGV